MDHFIEQIVIDNFKSIRHLQLDGLKRIHLFIGRANVGKSNILEALSLFILPYVLEKSKKLTDLIRLGSPFELFFDGNYSQECIVSVGLSGEVNNYLIYEAKFIEEKSVLQFETYVSETISSQSKQNQTKFEVDSDLSMKNATAVEDYELVEHILRYSFMPSSDVQQNVKTRPWVTSLSPPFGDNMLNVLEQYSSLVEYFSHWFKQYGLRLVLDRASRSLKVMKDKGSTVFILPYSSVADTLQRIIFYKTAIVSNQYSVLLFEEPEAHAFPPYIVEFTQEVVQSPTNQFFIVTHSPLIVEEFLTNAIDDLGIFNVDFKDGQTVVRPLTTEEIYDVRKYGVDLFFNNEAYLA